MYMCIFHYFNYYLPDFVTAVCLGFIFGFSSFGFCFVCCLVAQGATDGWVMLGLVLRWFNLCEFSLFDTP